MKKLIAISVVFALCATSAFAQLNIGGGMKMGTLLLGGFSVNSDVSPTTPLVAGTYDGGNDRGITMYDGFINVTWSGDTSGGLMRFHTSGQNGAPYPHQHTPIMFAYWWWRPIDMLKVQIGQNPDGDWGHAQITGWGYMGDAQAGVVVDEWRFAGMRPLFLGGRNISGGGRARGPRQFAPGVSELGMNLEFTPVWVEGLKVSAHIPFSKVIHILKHLNGQHGKTGDRPMQIFMPT